MPTLRGTLDVFGSMPPEPCRWCGEPTFTRLAPEGVVRERIPLHAICGAEVIVLYADLRSGRLIPADVAARLRALGDGS